MKRRKRLKSALFAALFLFPLFSTALYSLPLTETVYTIPEGGVELAFHEEYVNVSHFYRKEHIELGFGVLTDFSLWFRFDLLHGEAFEMDRAEIGDLSLKLWYYIGDYFNDVMHIGMLFRFRFPTGKDAYIYPEWRNLCLGNHEITLGPSARFDLDKTVFFHANIFFTFRQARNEDFYGGFYLNPVNEETYVKLFGLNPFAEGTFLSGERLKNDYFTLSLAVNTNVIHPFIPYVELYGAFRPYRGKITASGIPIEAAGVDSFLISAGLRYFFLRAVYLGIYFVVNPLMDIQKGYIKNVIGVDFSYQF
ncbi:MAG TPA: hypothetical protein P5346_07525 [Spirochaetota bacterium]|nr:hypothetical protein [Spirochaetota bacterium]